mmetsp:Transcript_52987/g.139674  ORF Transcript_52987/g.139674 Transcript_52987/m.139674 type:complete len:110 (-) Transcript_52987:1229-1558(-)
MPEGWYHGVFQSSLRFCGLLTCHLQVRMITGDNILTAKSIAKEIGIYTNGIAIEGPDFRKQSPEEQKETLKTMQVMARCSPQDKLTMVRRLKEMGEVSSHVYCVACSIL